MAKDFAVKFYNSKRWRHCADAYLSSVGYLCEECLKAGRIETADIVHHVRPLTPANINNPEIALSFSNLEAVCRSCHAKLHGYEKKQRRIVYDDEGRVLHVMDDPPCDQNCGEGTPQPCCPLRFSSLKKNQNQT